MTKLGLNEQELARNPQLNHYSVQNLNENTKISLESNLFDAGT